MHLKEIRIAGFKSFVDPENVPILEGLTGIVGPNGCGKSNVLEAMRWAMGANSAKAMRAGEMDDLIFSGAAGRPAREHAEVTLVLDNTARTAPAEFNAADTLEVTRRLKRGAGSSYKMNGKTVRGKDIKLLFADASTGANSPSLVRQGQISELIGAKPQNRRRILEEAAGIAGLNTRRHEAELKLRAAEANLERLSEVSAEVERQLESLKRQARKARKYKDMSTRIVALEAWHTHLRWQSATADQEAAAVALARSKSEVERLTREAAIAETRRLETSQDLAPLRDAESIAAGKLGQARIELARLDAEHQAADKILAGLERELSRLSEDIQRHQSQKIEAEQTLAEAKDALAALPVEDAAANQDKEVAAQAALETARTNLLEAETAADKSQQIFSEKRAEIQALEASAAAHLQRKERLDSQVQAAREALANLPQKSELSAALTEAQQLKTNAEQAILDAQTAYEESEKTLNQRQEAESEAKRASDQAQDALRTLETEISGLTRLLRQATRANTPPVIEQMRTREGYEKAVAAALGDDLQASTDPSAALHWAGSSANPPPLPGHAKPMTDFVAAPGELSDRLSQCGVVSVSEGESLASALQPGQRLVSLDGHLWRWDGFRRTPAAPLAAAERLAQQAQLEDAQAKIGPSRQAASDAQARYAEARGARLGLEADLKDLKQHVSQAATQLDQARQKVTKADQEVERAQLKADTAQDTLGRLEEELALATETYATAARPENTEQLQQFNAAAETARAELTVARAKETEARGRLSDLTRNREQAMQRRTALSEDVSRWQQRSEAAAKRVEEMLTRRSAAVQETQAAKARPDALQQKLIALRQRVETLELERQSAADTLAERERETASVEESARSTHNLATSAREALAVATARLDNAGTRLASVTEFARTSLQRTPEGLYPLAQAGLSAEDLEITDLSAVERQVDFLRRDREALGGVNMEAEAEVEELTSRLGLQAEEKSDLNQAIDKLREGVAALNQAGRDRLLKAFEQVNTHFKSLFTTLFRGGEAELRLVDADDPLAAGLEIFAQPPGKRLGTLSLMSGGEQALTAAALIFAVFLSQPSPICVLDEVDAPLDDANVDRFCRMLDEMRKRTDTRFICITHNPVTMSRMDRLYGVTMREKGVSKLVSVTLDTAESLVAAE